MSRRASVLAGAILAAVVAGSVAASGPLFANGEEFFQPAGDGPIDLVYVGKLKDKRTGRSITDHAYFTIRDNFTGMNFQFISDRPGHYRSPDVGAAIKELGETVDADQLEISVKVPGYKGERFRKVPRKSAGTVEINFEVEPEPATIAAQDAKSGPPMSFNTIAVIGIAIIALTAVVGRTAVRRQSTSH